MSVFVHFVSQWVSRHWKINCISNVLCVIHLCWSCCIFLLVSFKFKSVPRDHVCDRDADHWVVYSTFCCQCDWNLWVLEGQSFRSSDRHFGVFCTLGVVPYACLCGYVVQEVTFQHTVDQWVWKHDPWVDLHDEFSFSQHISLRKHVIQEKCQFQGSSFSDCHFSICSDGVNTEHANGTISSVKINQSGHFVHDTKIIASDCLNTVVSCSAGGSNKDTQHDLVWDTGRLKVVDFH